MYEGGWILKIRQLFGERGQEDRDGVKVNPDDSGDPGSKTVRNSRKVQAEALIEKARSLFDQASEDDREDLINLIEAIGQAMADDDEDLLEEHMEELSEIIFFMES